MNAVHSSKESSAKESDSLKDTPSSEDFTPIGTFGGSEDFIVRIRRGNAVAANTGDQGGGQN